MKLNLFRPQQRRPDGALHRRLSRMFPSWAAAPVRRTVQALSLALFLVLFFYVAWPYGTRHYADALRAKELVPAESFLALDPLVSTSTALAGRVLVWSLAWAAVVVLAGLVFPRGFCGYVCPLGTLTDLVHRLTGRPRSRPAQAADRWWHRTKYGVLAAVVAGAALGFLLSGFVAPIPVLVRGMTAALGTLQLGLLKGWYLIPPLNVAYFVSAALLLIVLLLGLLGERFWCRHLCPSGALLSVTGLLRLTRRKVSSNCVDCGRCVDACPFGAITPDYATLEGECTFCQTCGGVCPVSAIDFTARWDRGDVRSPSPAVVRVSASRRGFLAAAVIGPAAALGLRRLPGFTSGVVAPVVRPPGSVPEREFLRLCVSCAECFKACPNNVLQPVGLEGGLEGLGTPQAVADWSGCEPTCNNCGQVCPTGAIRALPLEEKRAARMGLAVVNEATCLPYAGRQACRMCYDECRAAGYDAIEFVQVGAQLGDDGLPAEGSGFVAPVVLAHKCVGCGLCQTRCNDINVRQKGLLRGTAVAVAAGPGREDRMMTGSYVALREQEEAARRREQEKRIEEKGVQDTYLPDFLK